jgi:aspartate/methionine/tyrosine aminotransferase
MKVKASNRLGDVKEYYFSVKLRQIAEMRSQGIKVLNLGIGSPDLPASETVIDTLKEATSESNANQYQGYSGLIELRTAFSEWYQTHYNVSLNPTNEILPLMGSKEGIMHISMAFLNAGDKVLVPNPGYPTYSSATRLAGGEAVYYNLNEENNWLPNFEELEQLDLTEVKIMWVNYPHMPTGAPASSSLFEQLVAFGLKHNILICNDNPYSFILNDNPQSILSVDGAKEIALELNSLSKSHNMAGWRMGMLAGHPDYISTILRFKSNMDSGMFKPVQRAATAALQLPKSWYDGLNAIYAKRQQAIYRLFDELDCTYDSSKGGMFVWAKVPSHYKSGYELSDKLLEKAHVFITPGGIFGTQGDNYIRASLCNPVEVIEDALSKIVGSLELAV